MNFYKKSKIYLNCIAKQSINLTYLQIIILEFGQLTWLGQMNVIETFSNLFLLLVASNKQISCVIKKSIATKINSKFFLMGFMREARSRDPHTRAGRSPKKAVRGSLARRKSDHPVPCISTSILIFCFINFLIGNL